MTQGALFHYDYTSHLSIDAPLSRSYRKVEYVEQYRCGEPTLPLSVPHSCPNSIRAGWPV